MKEAITKAIEGGYDEMKFYPIWKTSELGVGFHKLPLTGIFLDPLFWQALGKSLGWTDTDTVKIWKYNWHLFIDHLASGKDPESFFKTLLT